jgi:hypothetical protein
LFRPDLRPRSRLNANYVASDQNRDVARYEQILAEDCTATLPDLVFRNRQQLLDLIAQPRPFTDLQAHDVQIRILGAFALIHGRVTYTTLDGVNREARYTDDYQRRNGQWVCIAANVVAKGE